MAKILVIEDHRLLGRLYQTVLGRSEHKVILAENGEAGVAAMESERSDLVIMDLMLPGMSGLQAGRKLQEVGPFPGTPLIITTALTDAHASSCGFPQGRIGTGEAIRHQRNASLGPESLGNTREHFTSYLG